MNRIQESRRAALNREEAALLPAMPRIYPAGAAALRDAMNAARAIGEKQLSNLVDASAKAESAIRQPRQENIRHASRAALHQVLRRP
ncbi:MAG: hypothetical protein E7329_06845 [Clostridiales bacterium]|nr:hypothetical protein [Clostridiales bacterium]